MIDFLFKAFLAVTFIAGIVLISGATLVTIKDFYENLKERGD